MAVDVETEPTVQSDAGLDAAPDEGDHMTCCRDFLNDEPLVTLCGITWNGDLRPFSDFVCLQCVGVAVSRYVELGLMNPPESGEVFSLPQGKCMRDGSACPTGDEADRMYKRVLGMD